MNQSGVGTCILTRTVDNSPVSATRLLPTYVECMLEDVYSSRQCVNYLREEVSHYTTRINYDT